MGAADVRVARRRPRRHRLGFALFTFGALVVLAIAFAAAGAFDRGDDEGARSRAPTSTTTALTTPTSRPPAGPYKVTADVNVRSGPATSSAVVGTIEPGKEVLVACTVEGQVVTVGSVSTNLWLKITSPTAGYVTHAYVATGPAINDRAIIPFCTT